MEAEHSEAEKSLAVVAASRDAIRSSCVQVASEHEFSMNAVSEELVPLTDATQEFNRRHKEVGSRCVHCFRRVRLLVERHRHLAGSEVVTMVRRLAKDQHSAALAQLASRVSAIGEFVAGTGEDLFAKVKGLIMELIVGCRRRLRLRLARKSLRGYCQE